MESKRLQEIQSEQYQRSFVFKRESVDEEARTVELAFSSEDPYRRWWGTEILGHENGEVRMDFLSSGSAPLLAQHDHEKQIGVIESARIDSDGRGRCTVRFGSGPLAEEYFNDVKDGIRKNVSVGYQIHDMKLQSTDDGRETYRVTDWEPFEASIVSVPADKTVGVGRSVDNQKQSTERKEEKIMDEKLKETPVVDVKKIETDTRATELERIREIDAIGKEFNMGAKAVEFIQEGKSIDQFRAYALSELKSKGYTPVETLNPNVGLSKKETKRYSFLRAINAMANPGNQRAQEAARFELECSEAVQTQLKTSAKGFMVPFEVMTETRTGQTAGTDTSVIAENLLTGSFIDLLRNAMMMVKMGITTIDGLVGDVAVPKLTAGYSAYWVAEDGDPTATAATFGQVALTPKTVGARTELSRKFLLQAAIGAENFARMELAMALALEIDRAIINGSGSSNQPTGILNTTGIGAVAGGTNGAALSYANVVKLWSEVATDNAAFGNTGFITNSKVAGAAMTIEKSSGSAQFLMPSFPDSNGMASLCGAKCAISNQVPATLTKGTGTGLSALIFGNFADVVVGHWGTLDLTVDPFSKAESGAVRVIALQDIDIAIKRAQSFAAIKDISVA